MTSPQALALAPHPYAVGDVVSNTVKILRSRLGLFAVLALIPAVFLIVVLAAAVAAFLALGGGALLLGLSSGSSRQTSAAVAAALAGIVVSAVLYLVAILGYTILTIAMQGRMAIATLDVLDGDTSTMASLKQATPGMFGRAAGLVGLYFLIGVGVYLVIGVVVFALVAGLTASGSARSGPSDAMAAVLALGLVVLFAVIAVLAVFISVRIAYTTVFLAEGRRPLGALKGSWSLTRGAFWHTFGYFFVAALMVWFASFAVSVVNQIIVSAFGMANLAALSNPNATPEQVLGLLVTLVPALGITTVLSFAVSLLTVPFMMIYTALMYRDQHLRNANPGLGADARYVQQSPYGQSPYVQSPYGQSAYGQFSTSGGRQAPGPQPPYAQQRPYGQQTTWGPSSQSGQPPYRQYGPPTYGQSSGGPSPYGQQNGQPSFGQQPPFGQQGSGAQGGQTPPGQQPG